MLYAEDVGGPGQAPTILQLAISDLAVSKPYIFSPLSLSFKTQSILLKVFPH